MGRCRNLSEEQVLKLRAFLERLKTRGARNDYRQGPRANPSCITWPRCET